jgi:tight adherence protein C
MLPLLGALLALTGIVLVMAGLQRRTPVLDELDDSAEFDAFRARLDDALSVRAVEGLGAATEQLVRRFTPSQWHENLQKSLRLAGLEVSTPPSLVYVGKAVGFVVGGLLLGGAALAAGVPAGLSVLLLLFGLVAGFMLPSVLINARAETRQNEIRRSLPEALDLMAISVQAGVGLEQAIAVVTERLRGPLGEEFSRFLGEVQLGFSRREALTHLRDRNSCPELSTFVLSLLQADALGIAIGEVLKTQAAEMRAKRRQRARERAAKAPVRLLFPLIFGILPALFVVILGPAGITISRSFSF